jgi:hypothetical protein
VARTRQLRRDLALDIAPIVARLPALLFGAVGDALDGIAGLGTEQLKKRCRGTLELLHGVVQPVARSGSAAG